MKKILATLALILVTVSWANAQAVDDTNVVTKFCYNGICYQFPTVLTTATLTNDRYISDVQLSSKQLNFTGANGAFNSSIDFTSLLSAGNVTFTPYSTLASTTVQAAIQELLDESGGGSDGNDFVTAASLAGTTLTLTVPNQTDPTVDLSALQDGTGTDDQTAAEVAVTDAGANYTATDVEGVLAEIAPQLGGGTGDFLADGSVPMTGQLDINTTAGIAVSTQGTSGATLSTAAEIGFDDFDTNGEAAKFTFGDDFNSIVNTNGDGMAYRSYWTEWHEGGHEGGQVTDGDNYFNISGVSYNFLNANNKAFRISEKTASSTADYLQFYNQEGTKLSSFDVNGVLQGIVAYDNTSSGLTATDTQAAIDEVEGRVDAIEGGGSGISSDVAGFTNASTVDNIIRGNQTDIDGWTIPAGTVAICDDCIDYDYIQIAASDLTTDITTGTTKAYFRMPYAATLSDVRVSLLAAGTTTGITVDINENGTTVLSTKLTTDATEKTSTTATTAAVISDNALADDAEITIDFDAVPTNGQGVIVTLKLIKQ